jgi:hypothetical protein
VPPRGEPARAREQAERHAVVRIDDRSEDELDELSEDELAEWVVRETDRWNRRYGESTDSSARPDDGT